MWCEKCKESFSPDKVVHKDDKFVAMGKCPKCGKEYRVIQDSVKN